LCGPTGRCGEQSAFRWRWSRSDRTDVDQTSNTTKRLRVPHGAETAQDTPEARFGAVLRGLRVRAGLTLRELGAELHRAHSTISDFEKGLRLPAVDVVEQYEDYFKLPRGTLVAQRERARAERLRSPQDGTVDRPPAAFREMGLEMCAVLPRVVCKNRLM
jgi:transcriptional regulator with XRE-family HTH domain